ncbi:type VI secretion system baseplate subunit TssG [Photobacterium sp. TY1-4]|uniref:type VI secretion system baseplate subunit TssG n=1 Tax=Photobacterium sp. TY1-4 TaxID=2899122 RepID=UPI0021C13C8B|nr:type VI secretion system baseplate subunit TssG [Photobacterium sp. TY1-4]UXI02692.1 type VI secretion system baseplate subunit TssG [Photobacterium sp. TY1-4]
MINLKLISSLNTDDYYGTIYALKKHTNALADETEFGTDCQPVNETIRFSIPQHLGFTGSVIDSIRVDNESDGKVVVDVNLMGLTGPNGALPRHYTELILERVKNKDTAMRDFFDIFNHRLISLQYRAWEKYQYHIAYERYLTQHQSTFDDVLKSITGSIDDISVFFGGFFSGDIRNTSSLKSMLAQVSGCEIHITEFVGRWISLDAEEQTQLATRVNPEGNHARLGVSTMIGRRAWDISSAVEIEVVIDNESTLSALMNNDGLKETLFRLASYYLPPSIQAKWKISAGIQSLPICRLSHLGPRLGMGGVLFPSKSRMKQKITIPIQ